MSHFIKGQWTSEFVKNYEQRQRAKRDKAGGLPPCPEPQQAVRSDKGTKRPRHFNECIWCGTQFQAAHSHGRKYCSPECAYADPARTACIKPKDRGNATCIECGKVFAITRMHRTGKFCSQPCAARNTGRRFGGSYQRAPRTKFIEIACKSCGKVFSAWTANDRKYCSNACSTKDVKAIGKHRSGWITAGGKRVHVRSQWEANYAFYLEFQKRQGLIVEWDFEPLTFWFEKIKRGVRSYLPDFRIVRPDSGSEYHEVKGWMDQRSHTKLKRMAKYFPLIKIVLIDAPRYKAIAKTASKFVPGWGTIPVRQEKALGKDSEYTEVEVMEL